MFYRNRILKDLPLLLKEGVIDEVSKDKLEEYYSRGTSVYESIKMISLYIVGAIFLMFSAYLFINYNWSIFPNWLKVMFMHTPLAISAAAIILAIKKQTQLRCIIALALNLTGVILALLTPAVLYNIITSQVDFFTAIVILFCPIALLFRIPTALILVSSCLLALKISIAETYFLPSSNFASFVYLFLGAIATWQVFNYKDKNIYDVILNTVSGFLLFLSFLWEGNGDGSIERAFLACFAILGFAFLRTRVNFSIIALIPFVFMSGILSTSLRISTSIEDIVFPSNIYLNIATLLVATASLIFLAMCVYKKLGVLKIATLCVLLAQFLVVTTSSLFEKSIYIKQLSSNIALLVLFAIIFARGLKEKSLALLNSAFAVIIYFSIVKFFDKDWSMLERSALFLCVSIVMIASNIKLNRKIKQDV